MAIKVKVNVIREIMTRTSSKLRKSELKSNGKPTTESQMYWIHPVRKRNDGKEKYVEVWDRSNRTENGLDLARNQRDSHPICGRDKWHRTRMILAVR